MTKPNYNQMTRKLLLADGWPLVEVVEHWDSWSRRTKDLFTIFDILAVGPQGTMGVQMTSRGNMASRRRKIAEYEHLHAIRAAGWQIRLIGFDQPNGPRTAWRTKQEDLSHAQEH